MSGRVLQRSLEPIFVRQPEMDRLREYPAAALSLKATEFGERCRPRRISDPLPSRSPESCSAPCALFHDGLCLDNDEELTCLITAGTLERARDRAAPLRPSPDGDGTDGAEPWTGGVIFGYSCVYPGPIVPIIGPYPEYWRLIASDNSDPLSGHSRSDKSLPLPKAAQGVDSGNVLRR
jgi:hypothetical protein